MVKRNKPNRSPGAGRKRRRKAERAKAKRGYKPVGMGKSDLVPAKEPDGAKNWKSRHDRRAKAAVAYQHVLEEHGLAVEIDQRGGDEAGHGRWKLYFARDAGKPDRKLVAVWRPEKGILNFTRYSPGGPCKCHDPYQVVAAIRRHFLLTRAKGL